MPAFHSIESGRISRPLVLVVTLLGAGSARAGLEGLTDTEEKVAAALAEKIPAVDCDLVELIANWSYGNVAHVCKNQAEDDEFVMRECLKLLQKFRREAAKLLPLARFEVPLAAADPHYDFKAKRLRFLIGPKCDFGNNIYTGEPHVHMERVQKGWDDEETPMYEFLDGPRFSPVSIPMSAEEAKDSRLRTDSDSIEGQMLLRILRVGSRGSLKWNPHYAYPENGDYVVVKLVGLTIEDDEGKVRLATGPYKNATPEPEETASKPGGTTEGQPQAGSGSEPSMPNSLTAHSPAPADKPTVSPTRPSVVDSSAPLSQASPDGRLIVLGHLDLAPARAFLSAQPKPVGVAP